MNSSMTRRQLAAAVAVAIPAAAQPAAAASSELDRAMEVMRANSQRLSALKVPATIEPAFVFKP